MARPEIKGLKYFPFDTGFFRDKKIRLLRGEVGSDGVEVYIRLVSKCYEDNGYYLNWDDNEDYALLADETGYPEDKVRLIVSTCLRRSLFDDTLFKVGNVLTSRGIQRRYFSAIKDTKEKAAAKGRYTEIEKSLCLLTEEDFSELNKQQGWLQVAHSDSYSEINPDKSGINGSKSGINSLNEMKGNESKVKESKKRKPRVSESGQDIFAGRSFSPILRSEIEGWLRYKKERHEEYKPTGLQKLLSQIENKMNEYSEDQIIHAISESMARNYAGMIWDLAKSKKGVHANGTHEASRGGAAADYESALSYFRPAGTDD